MFSKLKIKNAMPIILFCGIFMVYTIYFVKVINAPLRLERNSFAKSILRSRQMEIQKPPMTMNAVLPKKPKATLPADRAPVIKKEVDLGTEYVNFAWLNVRKEASLGSLVVAKIYLNDAVTIRAYPAPGWALIETKTKVKGYVATKYLTKTKPILRSTKSSFEGQASNQPTSQPANQQTVYQIPTITYHHISDNEKYELNLNLAVANFLAQLDYLVANKVATLTFYDLEAIQKGQMVAPAKAIILTFDDGYDDAYQVAQHLNGKGLKGVFFAITGKVGTPGYLTWDQVKKMRSWGMEIGSHTVHHPDLVQSSIADVKRGLADSKKTLEEKLGERIVSFCYPASRYNSAVVAEVKNAGYLFARTEVPGRKYSEKNFLQLPTLRVFPPAGAKQFKVWLSS